MRTLSVAILLLLGQSAAAEEFVFRPSSCEYSVSFPIQPEISRKNAPAYAKVAGPDAVAPEVAETPGSFLPWLVAQCFQRGDNPLSASFREEQDRAMLGRIRAQNIASESMHQDRGELTVTTGDVLMEGRPMKFTKLFLVGKSSFLLATVLEPAEAYPSDIRRAFVNSIRKSP